ARKCARRRPTAADQIKLLVMKSDYKDVDIGEPYWDQIASLPCLPWNDIAIGREIGTGAFGNVHEGRTADGQIFAVKTICMNKSTSAEAQREFAFEALFMHKFNHPNIVRLHWIQWDPPRLRIILEFMGGGDLRSFLREARPTQDDLNPYDLRILNLIEIALDIARGVVLWEISSFGMLPYFGVDNFDVMGLSMTDRAWNGSYKSEAICNSHFPVKAYDVGALALQCQPAGAGYWYGVEFLEVHGRNNLALEESDLKVNANNCMLNVVDRRADVGRIQCQPYASVELTSYAVNDQEMIVYLKSRNDRLLGID
ncbi:hypothetical protein TELCIR_18488, partial [Teladorsagia circumcincta]